MTKYVYLISLMYLIFLKCNYLNLIFTYVLLNHLQPSTYFCGDGGGSVGGGGSCGGCCGGCCGNGCGCDGGAGGGVDGGCGGVGVGSGEW